MVKSTNLRDKCVIVGIGDTPYTRGTDKSTARLHLEAACNAIADAGLSRKDIDGYLPYYVNKVLAEDIITNLGIHDLKYTIATHMGGASAVAAIESAVMAITCGVVNYVLLTVGRRGYSEQRASKMGESGSIVLPQFAINKEFEVPYGQITPAQLFAAQARRHFHEYGTTSRHLGLVSVACRKHAQLNPKAVMYGKPMTIEDHQNSRIIADPLRLFDCSLETDGAGAVIITSVERARALKQKPVYIMGVAQGHPDQPRSFTEQTVMSEIQGIRYAAKRAFATAGVAPKDVDVAELYDGFTWVSFCSLEDIGFCKKGEAGGFVEGGRIELGGELPINTHGGLVSEAHVSGINHVIEAVRQLRGDCGERQVKNAEIALVTGAGDFADGSVMLLRR